MINKSSFILRIWIWRLLLFDLVHFAWLNYNIVVCCIFIFFLAFCCFIVFDILVNILLLKLKLKIVLLSKTTRFSLVRVIFIVILTFASYSSWNKRTFITQIKVCSTIIVVIFSKNIIMNIFRKIAVSFITQMFIVPTNAFGVIGVNHNSCLSCALLSDF